MKKQVRNNEETSEKYLGNKREKPGTGHRSIALNFRDQIFS